MPPDWRSLYTWHIGQSLRLHEEEPMSLVRVYEADTGLFCASVPGLPGWHSPGVAWEEAVENI